MFRWKYIIPRLVLLGGLLLLIAIGTNPLLRWGMISTGQAITGATVDIRQLRALFSTAELRLSQLALADPQSPMRNLFEANEAVLDVDMAHLLRRRLVVNEGHVGGILLGTPRASSGALPKGPPRNSDVPTWTQKATEAGEQWLDGAAEKLGTQLESDLKSVALGRELIERWPREYELLEQDVKAIRDRYEHLLKTVKATKQNPIRSIEHYQHLMADIESVRRDTLDVRSRFELLKRQMQLDRVAIEEAKQQDAQYVRRRLQLAKLDPEAISNYLLGPELGPQIGTLVNWLQWGRQQLPSNNNAPRPTSRGWDLVLPGTHTDPTLLVRKLKVDGGGSANGEPFQFQGTVQGLTTQPRLYGKPAVLSISTDGSLDMVIQAVLDHTQDVAKDQIIINFPQFVQPGRVLGSADKLAVKVEPGSSSLRIQIDLTGDQLDGVIQFQQPSTGLSATVGDKLGGRLVADRLNAATSSVRELSAAVRLDGTLRNPGWHLDSNIGKQLAAGLQQAFTQELEYRQQQLLATAYTEVDRQMMRIQQEIVSRQNELWTKLDLDSNQLDLLNAEIAKLGLPGKLLGDGLLKDIFRR